MVKKEQPYKSLGNKLRELRGQLTQKEFAAKIRLPERVYQRYEYGERLPGLEVLLRVSHGCNVPIRGILADFQDKQRAKELIEASIDIVEGVIADLVKGKAPWGAADLPQNIKPVRDESESPLWKIGWDYMGGNPLFDSEDLNESIGNVLYILNRAPDAVKERVIFYLGTIAHLTSLIESNYSAKAVTSEKKGGN